RRPARARPARDRRTRPRARPGARTTGRARETSWDGALHPEALAAGRGDGRAIADRLAELEIEAEVPRPERQRAAGDHEVNGADGGPGHRGQRRLLGV